VSGVDETPDIEAIMSLVAARCPEVSDLVVPVAAVEILLAVVEDFERRLAALQEAAGGFGEVGAQAA
jgi:hypothetical protein